jgi:type I restriction enzyme S subunit
MKWQPVPLESVAEIQLGKMLSGKASKGESPAPYLRNANVQWGRLVLDDLLEMDFSHREREKFSLIPGDLIVCEGGEPGRCAVVTEPMRNIYYQKALMRVRPQPERLTPQFLQRFMRHAASRGVFRQGGNQSTIAHFPAVRLRALQVPLPPLSEQNRIAAILDTADALRTKRRESIEQLDSLVQATFLEMFGDPVTNPKGWETKPIANLGEVQGGLQVTSKRKSLSVEQPYLRVANVFRGALDLAEIKRIRMTPHEASRTALEKDDLLIVEGHGNKDEVGRCARWDGSISPCVHQNHLIRLRCCRSMLEPGYAEAFLNSTGGRCSLVESSRTTSGLNTISVSKVRDTVILMPPLDLQTRFASIVESIEQQKARLKAHLAELDTLFASLQSRAFNGEMVA